MRHEGEGNVVANITEGDYYLYLEDGTPVKKVILTPDITYSLGLHGTKIDVLAGSLIKGMSAVVKVTYDNTSVTNLLIQGSYRGDVNLSTSKGTTEVIMAVGEEHPLFITPIIEGDMAGRPTLKFTHI